MDQKPPPQPMTQEEVSEALEHRDMLLDVRALLKTPSGRRFVSYLFKYYSPIDLPPEGVDGTLLHEKLGMLRAFNELFKIIAEADFEAAGQLLAEVEKKKHDAFVRQNLDEQGR